MSRSGRVILGIVAEYDPLHNGHMYHLNESRKRVAADYLYVALSPCFKQRGELSMLSPVDRARCAVRCGADAVFALPVLWTIRDAEHYALGAVAMLAGLGITHLAFGAETADSAALARVADLLEDSSAAMKENLRSGLDSGLGYPAALSRAAASVLPEAGDILSQPNNTLAVCYLRAIRKLKAPVIPVAIGRKGGYHDTGIDPDYPSASALRDALRRGAYAPAYAAVPPCTAELITRRFLEGRIPDPRITDALLLSALRQPGVPVSLPDVSEGLDDALRSAASFSSGREELIANLSGKRYPASRISRLCAMAMLGAGKEHVDSLSLPSEAMLLAVRKNPDMTSGWKNLPVHVCSSFGEWKEHADSFDLKAWTIWAQAAGMPDTLPFSERIAAE